MAALATLLYFLIQLVIHASALFETIDDNDPRVQYVPPTILPEASCKDQPGNEACTGHWWIEEHRLDLKQTIHETFGPNTIVTLEFQGSGITMFGATLGAGAIAVVTVDSAHTTRVNFSSANSQRNPGVQLFTLSDLDPSVNHTFTMRFDDGSFGPSNARHWMSIDYFEVSGSTNDDSNSSSAAAGSGAVSSSIANASSSLFPGAPSAAPSSPAVVSHVSNSSVDGKLLGTIFGAAVGGVLFIALVFFVVWRFWFRRPVAPSAAARAGTLPTINPPVRINMHSRRNLAMPTPRRVEGAPYPFVGGSNSGSSEAPDVRRVSVTYPSSGSSSPPPPPPPPRQLPPTGERRRTLRMQRVFTVANPDAQASTEGR